MKGKNQEFAGFLGSHYSIRNLNFFSKKRLKFALVFSLLLVFLSSPFVVNNASASTSVSVAINSQQSIGTNQFRNGVQFAQPQYDATQVGFAQAANVGMVRIFTTSIEPCTWWNEYTKSGEFDWTKVDAVVLKILEIGAQPLLTLGNVNGGTGTILLPYGMATNPSTGLPYPDSYAAYARAWVQHFQAKGWPVKYYEIINEPYAYFGWIPNTTKLANYMQLFNTVSASMRQQNSNLDISFDFIMQQNVLDYWLANGGAQVDSLNFHKYDSSTVNPYPDDSYLFQNAEEQFFGQWPLGYTVVQAQQKYYQATGRWLPIIDSESNMNGAWLTGTDPRIQQMTNAVWLAMKIRMDILNGVSYDNYFVFSSYASWCAASQTGGYGLGLINSETGNPWYPYYVMKMIGSNLGVGDQLVSSSYSSSALRSLAWIHGSTLNILLIGNTYQQLAVQFQGLKGYANYYKIDNSIWWQNPSVQTGSQDLTGTLTLNGYAVMLLQTDVSNGIPINSQTTVTQNTNLFSDGFESGSFSQWNGVHTSLGETAAITSSVVHDGSYAGLFASSGGGGFENAYTYKTLASQQSELYAKGFVNVVGSGLGQNDARFYFIQFFSGSNAVAYAGWRMVDGVPRWNLIVRDGGSWVNAYSSAVPNVNQWYSVELHWLGDYSNGGGELYVNGQLVASAWGKNTAALGNVDSMSFGLGEMVNCYSTTVYGDSVAILNSYI